MQKDSVSISKEIVTLIIASVYGNSINTTLQNAASKHSKERTAQCPANSTRAHCKH